MPKQEKNFCHWESRTKWLQEDSGIEFEIFHRKQSGNSNIKHVVKSEASMLDKIL